MLEVSESILKERFGGDDQLMKEQLQKEDDQRKEGLENVKSAVKKDEKVALENVDINALGLYTLGELRKSSSENDIDNY
mgnify:CR=1 FL=1